MLRSLAGGLLELCFPWEQACPICGSRMAGETRVSTTVCPACLQSYAGVRLDPTPGSMHFSRARGAGPYTGALKRAIWRFKYEGRQHLAWPLGALMAASAADLRPFDTIVPVPLHPRREAERGFNQSSLLAKSVANITGTFVAAGKLTRARETLPQNRLDQDERRRNVSGAFRLTGDNVFSGRRVVLVDDVLTTGSTADECSRVIRAGGADSVDILACAIVGGN